MDSCNYGYDNTNASDLERKNEGHILYKNFLNGSKVYHDHLSPRNLKPAEVMMVKWLGMRESDRIFKVYNFFCMSNVITSDTNDATFQSQFGNFHQAINCQNVIEMLQTKLFAIHCHCPRSI